MKLLLDFLRGVVPTSYASDFYFLVLQRALWNTWDGYSVGGGKEKG